MLDVNLLSRSNEHNDSAPVVNGASVQHHLRGQSRPDSGVRLTRSATTDERWVNILVEMKQGQCICPLSWSVHRNFTGDGNTVVVKGGGRAPPHPNQPG
jgi:hypothetical protein